MASARIEPLSYNTKTYGAAGNGRDYVEGELANWEAATDNDLVTATKGEVLDCYADAASYDDYSGQVAGATTDSDYYRVIRTASGEDQVVFNQVGAVNYPWWMNEGYLGIQNIKIDFNSAVYGIWLNYPGNHVVDCIVTGTATESLITDLDGGSGSAFIINCLFYEITGTGVRAYGFGLNEKNIYYNCTIADCTGDGFGRPNGNCIATNCISDGNGWADYKTSLSWVLTKCIDSTDNVVFADAANDDYSLDATDTAAKDQGNDLSADGDFAFDTDILNVTRSGTWDIGAYEYTTPVVTTSTAWFKKIEIEQIEVEQITVSQITTLISE